MHRPELEADKDKPKIQDVGCCEDMKNAYARVDKFFIRKYFAMQIEESEPA